MTLMLTFRAINILCLLLFLASGLQAQSTGEDASYEKRVEKKSAAKNRSAQSSLTAEEPSERSLEAFETRVEQKLRDLTDYVRIASDPSYEEELRDRARDQALDLFDSGSVRLVGFPWGTDQRIDSNVSSTLDSLRSKGTPKTSMEIENFRSEAFQGNEDGGYEGNFEFRMQIEFEDAQGKREEMKLEGKGVSVLKKVSKKFGDEEKRVWETFLGDLEFSE